MKKLLTMFALGSTMMFASCGNKSSDNEGDSQVVTLDKQSNPTASVAPCIIEVPCDEPELTISGHEHLRKFYDFCDSTVTVTWNSLTASGGYTNGYYTKNHQTRPITELHGTEKIEMERAHVLYQQKMGLK